MARPARRRASSTRARLIQRPLVVALVACGAIAPIGAGAASIAVTTGGDAGTPATCTLRQAAESLNGASLVGACVNTGPFGNSDIINLGSQVGTIALAGTAVPLAVPVTVVGPGHAVLTISGAGASRVFEATVPAPEDRKSTRLNSSH